MNLKHIKIHNYDNKLVSDIHMRKVISSSSFLDSQLVDNDKPAVPPRGKKPTTSSVNLFSSLKTIYTLLFNRPKQQLQKEQQNSLSKVTNGLSKIKQISRIYA